MLLFLKNIQNTQRQQLQFDQKYLNFTMDVAFLMVLFPHSKHYKYHKLCWSWVTARGEYPNRTLIVLVVLLNVHIVYCWTCFQTNKFMMRKNLIFLLVDLKQRGIENQCNTAMVSFPVHSNHVVSVYKTGPDSFPFHAWFACIDLNA